jgi:hypothetical protein
VLLFQSVLLASLASIVHSTPTTTHAVQAAPIWAAAMLAVQAPWRRLQLASRCGPLVNRSALPCFTIGLGQGLAKTVLAASSYADPEVKLPRKNDSFRTLGGFVHLDILDSPNLRSGPELSWSTPDSPREDLQKTRLLSPGWGVRYTWADSPVAFGVSACTRIVMMGRQIPMLDPLTSEARVEFRLP